MSQEIDILKRALQREKAARKSAEKILEAKSLELFQTSQRLEQLLAEKSSELQGVFENIIDAYVIIDTEGNILKCNEAASALFGIDIELDPINVIDLIYKADYKYAVNSFMNLQNKGFFKNYEARVITRANELKWVHINASMIFSKENDPIAAQGIVRDITEIKSLELQKETLLSKLEESNTMLQEYAHIVSHDLKSPLRSIDALVNWIKEDNKGKFDAVSLQNFALIETTLEKMELLITEVLAYSSIGADHFEEEDIHLDQLVKEVIDLMPRPEHIEIVVLASLPSVKGHPTKLQQLFQNLIGNAIKFNDKPAGKITINVQALNDEYKFSIKDNGIGIEEKYHEKIFHIFHALHKSKNSTGIGLSIVKKIVEMHGGRIWVDSEIGQGTTFYFTLKKRRSNLEENKTVDLKIRMPS